MSALPIDLPLVEIPAAGRQRWTYVQPAALRVPQRPVSAPLRPARDPLARPTVVARAPGGRPLGAAAPVIRPAVSAPVAAPLRLTRRGLAVVVSGFAALMVTAFVVLVAAFLAVSNEPVVSQLLLG